MVRWKRLLPGALLGAICWPLVAASGASPESSEPVELFAAIDAKQAEATLIPSNSRRATLQLANKTDRPLTIRLPRAAAGVPVLAQPQFPNFGDMQQNGNQNQPVGLPMNFFNRGQNQGQQPGGRADLLFSVPPGKTIKRRVPAVCLRHGLPNPNARIEYRLCRLETVCDSAELVEVLDRLGREQCTQRVAQAAAWHLSDGFDWDRIESLRIEHLNGVSERMFTRREVDRARAMMEDIVEPEPSDPDSPGRS